jgi:hypothetical protein
VRVATADPVDPLTSWQYAERYLGAGTRTYSRFSADQEVSPAYHPQLGGATFDVPTFLVPPRYAAVHDGGNGFPLAALYRHADRLLLPVHPDTLDFPGLAGRDLLNGFERGPVLTAVPSANARTVFVTAAGGDPVPPHFLKLHFPRRLSRFTRRLRRPMIELHLWVARELARAGIPILHEVFGGSFGTEPTEAWGFVVRELTPRGVGAGGVTVPTFALYGGDLHAPADPSLLEQLVAASGQDPTGYLVDRLVVPLTTLWFRAAAATGCSLEMHGQNTLFHVTSTGETQVHYRDCGIYIDPELRRRAGRGGRLPTVNVISADIRFPRGQMFSLAFDSFLGGHLLDRIAALGAQRLGVDPATLHEAARAVADRSDVSRLLPSTVYYYDDSVPVGADWRLVDTGRRPAWRS